MSLFKSWQWIVGKLLVNFTSKSKKIPGNIPDATTGIDLSKNGIVYLRTEDFKNCIEVRTLNLQQNGLEVIP